MAIMVTDPRNNLLSQLTAVGQQYLAGKQQERMSATEFSNKKALIELMDRLSSANDVREFGQEKELLGLQQANALGLLNATGAQRLKELEQAGVNATNLADVQGRYNLRAVEAGKPEPFDLTGTLQQLRAIFGDTAYPSVDVPSLTPEIRKTIIDMGGEDALRSVVGALDDPAKLRDLLVETEGNPLGVILSTLRSPGSPKNKAVTDFLQNRADSLERRSQVLDQFNTQRSDLAGLLQSIIPIALTPQR